MKILVLLSLLLCRKVDGFDRLWLRAHGRAVSAGFIMESAQERTQSEALARALLAPADVQIGSILFYQSREDYMRAREQGDTGCSYETWVATMSARERSEEPGTCPSIVEYIRVAGWLGSRRLLSNCEVEERSIQGSAPVSFQLVAMSIRESPGYEERPSAAFYLRTYRTPTAKDGQAVSEAIRRWIEVPINLTVVLRSDLWFQTHCEMPLFPTLKSGSTIPSRAELYRSRQVVCTCFGERDPICRTEAPQARDGTQR